MAWVQTNHDIKAWQWLKQLSTYPDIKANNLYHSCCTWRNQQLFPRCLLKTWTWCGIIDDVRGCLETTKEPTSKTQQLK